MNIDSYSDTTRIEHCSRAKALNFNPQQQRSNVKILRSADCYQQKFIKYPLIGVFHSYPELIHAALLEADKDVESFVPQPFRFRIGKQWYTPDCFYLKQGNRFLIEIKQSGELKDEIRIPIEEFCKLENMTFLVISNQTILAKEQLAMNWLKIIRVLNTALDIQTHDLEYKILDKITHQPECEISDFIFQGDRLGQMKSELALFRLTHKGIIKLDLETKPIEYSTTVTLCI